MTAIICESPRSPVSLRPMDEEPWQIRLKRAGLSQKMLARLLGVAENTVSLQLRGKWQSGVPGYVKTVIRMWELLPQKDRETIMDSTDI